MRLINTETLKLQEFVDDIPGYAILSHCWGEDEVTFKEYLKGKNQDGAGYKKILDCCKLARSRRERWVWIDTCCIDKRSSAELSEAINSMYAWYARATVCYAYLADVTADPSDKWKVAEQMRQSRWFTRGWTLQELIAPKDVIFVTKSWECISWDLLEVKLGMVARISQLTTFGFGTDETRQTSNGLVEIISTTTGIPNELIRGSSSNLPKDPSVYPAAARLSWMAKRSTTRVEDMAYCLLGLFKINMPLLYGEGDKALERLQTEILSRTGDDSLLCCRSSSPTSGFLQSRLENFSTASPIQRVSIHDRPQPVISTGLAQLRMTSGRKGVYFNRNANIHLIRLNCTSSFRGVRSPCVMYLRQTECGYNHFSRISPLSWPELFPSTDEVDEIHCEEMIRNPGRWIARESDETMLIHLTEADAINCGLPSIPAHWNSGEVQVSYRLS